MVVILQPTGLLRAYEVSEYLGTSTSLVYRYLRGEVLPSIDRIVALSVYLEVPIERIIAVE